MDKVYCEDCKYYNYINAIYRVPGTSGHECYAKQYILKPGPINRKQKYFNSIFDCDHYNRNNDCKDFSPKLWYKIKQWFKR